MAIQYYMRAYNTNLNLYVDWIVNDQPDNTGIYSPYLISNLTNIVVNKIVNSKVDNFLQPDEGYTASDGYFFHLNSFDWLHASTPIATVIPPPSNFVGIAVTRGGTTNSSGLLLPGASTNFFATLAWHEAQQRWLFVKNTNGDHSTLGSYLPVGMGSTIIDGYLAVGNSPTVNNIPTTGSIRLQNNNWITARKSNQTSDGYLIQLDTFDRTVLGASSNPSVYIPNDLRVDGYLRDGSLSPSTVGFIRNGNNTNIISFRSALNDADHISLSSGIVDTFNNNTIIGSNLNASVALNVSTGSGSSPNGKTGVSKFQVNNTTLVEIGTGNPTVNPFVRFTVNASNPSFTQTATSIGNGQTLIVQAQTTTGGNGGVLALAAGDGATNGTVDLYTGIPSAGNLKVRIFPTLATSALDNNSIIFFEKLLRFDALQVNPTIRQDSAASGVGKTLLLNAQSITTGTGGNLNLTSGTGTATIDAGNISLQTGGQDRLLIVSGSLLYTGTTTHNVNVQQFGLNVPNPSFIQEPSSGITGNTLTIRAQNALFNGGPIVISSGTGNGDGSLPGAGSFDIQTGTHSRILIVPTSTNAAVANFNINSFLITGGSDATNIPNPSWKQDDRTSGSANGQTFTIQAQNSTVASSVGGNLILSSGQGVSSDGNVRLQTGGTDRLVTHFNYTEFRDSNEAIRITPVSAGNTSILFASTVTSATLSHTSTASASGGNTTVKAQNSTFSGSTGGNLILSSGQGVSSDGNVSLQTGGTDRLVTHSSYTEFRDAVEAVRITPVSAGNTSILFASTVTSVTFNHTTTASASGGNTTLKAQNAATTGGNLYLTSGSGSSPSNNGEINLQTGGIDRIIVHYNYTEFRDTAEAIRITPASSGSTSITIASTATSANFVHTTTASASGGATVVKAQDAATTGGNLHLSTGSGSSSNGTLNLQVANSTTASLVTNKFVFNKGRRRHITNITAAYTILDLDDYLAITTLTTSYTVNLPASPVTGDCFDIKDTTGNASPTVTVTVSGNGNLIDGSSNLIFTQPYEAATFTYTNGEWSVT